jgi:hypothetical protein
MSNDSSQVAVIHDKARLIDKDYLELLTSHIVRVISCALCLCYPDYSVDPSSLLSVVCRFPFQAVPLMPTNPYGFPLISEHDLFPIDCDVITCTQEAILLRIYFYTEIEGSEHMTCVYMEL